MSRFKKLSDVLWRCQYHNVWVPKYRHRVLTGEVGQEVKNCIQVFSGQLGCEVVELTLNIQQDHIHLISNVPPNPSNGNMPMVPKTPNDWSAEEKLKAVLEASSLSDEQLGAFLRSKGIHETHLEQWRTLMLGGLDNGRAARKPPRRNLDVKRIRSLEKELRRKDKALAETAALLVLKKKVHQIWGDEDDNTAKRSGR